MVQIRYATPAWPSSQAMSRAPWANPHHVCRGSIRHAPPDVRVASPVASHPHHNLCRCFGAADVWPRLWSVAMPSRVHEVMVEMVRHRPAVVAELLTGTFKMELPDWRQVRTQDADLTELTPVQYRADAVTVFADARDNAVLAVVNEVQLRRDPRKRRTWPHYLTSLHARLGCPTMLLVMCTDAATARWCAGPIEIGHPGWVLRPLVVGPDTIPVITDTAEASRAPELAVLSAIAHGRGPGEEPIFRAMLTGLQTVDQDHFELYTDIVLTALPEAAQHCLEALMDVTTYEFQSDYFRRRLARSMA